VVIFELVFRLVSERDDVVLLRVLRGNARETLGGRRQSRGEVGVEMWYRLKKRSNIGIVGGIIGHHMYIRT
jgi:hypothetical protein